MDVEKLTDALCEKMGAEQDKYRAWLVAQPPEEILNHTAEYTTREDILLASRCCVEISPLAESPNNLDKRDCTGRGCWVRASISSKTKYKNCGRRHWVRRRNTPLLIQWRRSRISPRVCSADCGTYLHGSDLAGCDGYSIRCFWRYCGVYRSIRGAGDYGLRCCGTGRDNLK